MNKNNSARTALTEKRLFEHGHIIKVCFIIASEFSLCYNLAKIIKNLTRYKYDK